MKSFPKNPNMQLPKGCPFILISRKPSCVQRDAPRTHVLGANFQTTKVEQQHTTSQWTRRGFPFMRTPENPPMRTPPPLPPGAEGCKRINKEPARQVRISSVSGPVAIGIGGRPEFWRARLYKTGHRSVFFWVLFSCLFSSLFFSFFFCLKESQGETHHLNRSPRKKERKTHPDISGWRIEQMVQNFGDDMASASSIEHMQALSMPSFLPGSCHLNSFSRPMEPKKEAPLYNRVLSVKQCSPA